MTIVDEKISSRASSRFAVFVAGFVGDVSRDGALFDGYFCGETPRGVFEPDVGVDF